MLLLTCLRSLFGLKSLSFFFFANVCQEDCSQQEVVPDEVTQWSADLDDLDDLDNELDDLVAERTLDDLTPASHYLSRSLSRISRMEPQRVNTVYQFL